MTYNISLNSSIFFIKFCCDLNVVVLFCVGSRPQSSGLGRRGRGRWAGPGALPEGRKSRGKRQGELRSAAEITKQRRKKEAMRIRQQGGKKRGQAMRGGRGRQRTGRR